MEFEWDATKNVENIRKHGIDFNEAKTVFDGPTLDRVDDRFDYGETRTVSIGLLNGIRCIVVTHTDRGRIVRLISARKALKHERKRFETAIL